MAIGSKAAQNTGVIMILREKASYHRNRVTRGKKFAFERLQKAKK
jgi:hypothetical protein